MAVAIQIRETLNKHKINSLLLKKKAQRLLDALELTDSELSLLLTDDDEIQQLNLAYRDKDGPTDVLAFPLEDPDGLTASFAGPLGDVVISVDTARRQASDGFAGARLKWEGPWDFDLELLALLIHGTLHLVGHHHHHPDEETAMRNQECELFRLLA